MGWYHTGPGIREADLDISALMENYCASPLLVICEVEVRRARLLNSKQPRFRVLRSCSSIHGMPAAGVKTVVADAQPKDMGLPTTAYYTKDEIREVGDSAKSTLVAKDE